MWITHKTNFGTVELKFNSSAPEISGLQEIAEWLRSHGMPEITASVVGSSSVLQIHVPVILTTETNYEDVPDEDIEKALDAVRKLNSLAVFLEKTRLVAAYRQTAE